jgi:hypothetical protein
MFCQKCGTKNPDNGRFCRSCGTDLAGMAESQNVQGLNLKPSEYYIDRRGRVRSNNPDDLWSAGIRNTIMGVGFLIVAIVLLLTNVANGQKWWWAMLFPAFSLLAGGISNISKAKRLERKNLQTGEQHQLPLFAQPPTNASLPPLRQEYVEHQKSIYDTGELAVPSSVTEGTTRHLEINNEGETMTLPKK